MRKSAYIITLIAMLLPVGAWALGGSGTSSSPYTIANAADLVAFASKVNGGETGAYAKLTADITLTSAWTAMGTSSKPYTGTFDGQGHKISGLSLTATAANAGLFGYVNNATIQNFTLAGSISSGYENTGSVVGSADGATKIYNVYSSVNITMTAAKSHIGGIAGQLLQENSKNPEIKGCTYSGEMNLGSSTDSNGGIVGYCEKDANVQIEYCFFHGSISSSGSTPRIGGILGYADDENSQNFNYIRNCYCDGTLSPSSGTYVGAIAGYPRGNVPGAITNNTYKSGMATNALGNGKTSDTSTPITITVTAGSNGTVSKSYVNPTSTTATKLHVDATPNTGYHFANWNVSGAKAHDVVLTANVTRTATFGAHTYGDWITDKAATCTATGTKHHVCTFAGCDAREDGIIAALGHGTTGYTPTYTWGGTYSAATCTFTLKCNKCSSNVVTNQSLTPSKVSASHKDATCTAAGNERWTAKGNYSKSGDTSYSGTAQTKDYAIPALGHDFTSQTATDTYLKSAATCTADAVYYHKCSRCTTKGTSTWTKTGTATGHGHAKGYTPTYTWSDDINVHTCSFTLKCLDCNANVVSNSSLTGTETAHTDPTCTAAGSTTYQVTGSYSYTKSVAYNENNSKTYTIDALGHDMTENARVDATCTETGMDAYWTCSRCEGKLFKDENGTAEWDGMPVLAALGHTEVIDNAVAATCTTTGLTEGKHCSVCETVFVAQEVIVVTDHTFAAEDHSESVCTVCNHGFFRYTSGNGEVVTPYFSNHLLGADGVQANILSNTYANGQGVIEFDKPLITIGDKAFQYCSSFTGDLVIPNSVTTIGEYAFRHCNGFNGTLTLGGCIETIGDFAFNNCSGFTGALVIPNSVTTIGEYAFNTCTGFNGTLTLGSSIETIGDNAFQSCSGFTGDLVVPNFVTTIGSEAFYNCTGFNGTLTLGSSVKNIGTGAFLYCSGFTGDLVVPNSVVTIGSKAFTNCSGFNGTLTLGGSIETIGDYAFYNCSCFTGDLIIPNSVTTIGNYAFYECSSFNGTLTLGSSVQTIGDNAFQRCSGFTGALVIPNSVTTIGNDAFNNCTGFNGTLTLGSSVETIGESAFRYCSGFNGTLTLGSSVTTIGEYAFDGCSGFNGTLTLGSSVTTIGEYAFSNCNSFTGDLTIPNSVTTIGDYAFNSCSGFNGTLTLGSSVGIIGNSAFNYCTGFNGTLTLGSSVTTIGEFAFGECSGFTGDLVIPNSVTTIGNYAFDDCSGFNGTLTLGSSVQTIGKSAFRFCSDFTGNLVIPNSVTSIGEIAFGECSGFNGTLTLGSSIQAIGAWAFEKCTSFNSVELHSIPYTDWSFYGVTDNKTVVLNGNSYVYKGDNPDFPEVQSVTAPCTLDLTGSVVENHANLTVNHGNIIVDEAVAATCTTSGLTEGKHCSVCETVLVAQEVIAVLGHSFGNTLTDDPIEDGLYAYVCDNDCGGHSGDHIIKDFNGTGKHLELTKDGEGHYSTTENIEIIDATAFVSPVEFTAPSVEYTRTFGGTNWTTWYVPFDMELTEEICEKMDFSRINNVHQYDTNDDGVADVTEIESFRQHAGVTLKANYPYLVRAKDDNNLNIELALGNATVAAKDENSIVCRSVDYTYTFTGTYQGEGDSGLNGDSPYSLFDDVDDNSWYHFQNLAPQRHYMVITPRNGGMATPPSRIHLRIAGEEDVTGVVTLFDNAQQRQSETYDLSGRRIESGSQPGLRIVNGKVIFTK